jgi:probable phosphoglycerate mutase
LQRAVETINIILEGRRIEPVLAPGLREIALGPWEGKTQRETHRTHPREYQAFWQQPEQFALPGAESFEQLQQRVVREILNIFERHRKQIVLAVTHWIAIKTALAHFTSTPLNRLSQLPNLANGGQVHIVSDNKEIRVEGLTLPDQSRLY